MPSAVCRDLAELCRAYAAGAGAALLTEEALAEDGGVCLEAALSGQPAWSNVPLVVLARQGADGRHAALREFAAALVERPVRMRTLVSVVRAALRAHRHQYEVRDAIAARDRKEAECRQSEARLRFLDDLGEATRAASDPCEVMAVTARLLGEHLGATRCAYADVGP
ncbi:MAG: hypothetical protein ACRC33_17955, partial [Gemmataceae bacterium]